MWREDWRGAFCISFGLLSSAASKHSERRPVGQVGALCVLVGAYAAKAKMRIWAATTRRNIVRG